MPPREILAEMYGATEDRAVPDGPAHVQCGRSDLTIGALAELPVGMFLDYGCGTGRLLRRVRDLGWAAVGVEWNEDRAGQVTASSKCPVVTPAGLDALRATVIHVGDVNT